MDLWSSVDVFASFPWTTFCLALAVAILAITGLIPIAKRTGWVDKPGSRKAHVGEIPLIGGWAVLAATVASQFSVDPGSRAPTGYWVGLISLFVVALIDDRYPIRARYRFTIQVTAAIAGISMGGQALTHLGDLFGQGNVSVWWLGLIVSVFGTVALINAVNFMDGADGLCGGLGLVGLFWLLVSVLLAAPGSGEAEATHAVSLVPLASGTMGGLAGFLYFNLRTPWRRKAAVFLGDSGSMLVGFTLAWLAIHVTTASGSASVSPVTCLWIMAVPLFDSASCITRRILAGVTPMTPDMKHLHHLVRRCGFSIACSVLLIHACAFLCGLVGVMGWWLQVPEPTMFAAFALTLVLCVLVTNLAWREIDRKAGDQFAEIGPAQS